MKQEIVTIFGDDGPSQYRRFGPRVPEFLEKYPPADYPVETVMTDLLSLQTGRLALLKEAIAAGKKPADVGLPGIEADIRTMVCTVILRDRQNQVIRKANASAHLEQHKDFEALETAAHQRLLALLGFGGEVFQSDEDRDMDRQGLSRADSVSPSGQSPEESGAPVETSSVRTRQGGVPAALRRQVENLAKLVGEPVPKMDTETDAKAELQKLGAKQKQRRAS